MILVRDIFRLQYGRTREAVALWQEGLSIMRRVAPVRDTRLLTDLVGPYYTLVLETTFDSLSDLEQEFKLVSADPAWRAWYPRFVPLVESGHRELFTIVPEPAAA